MTLTKKMKMVSTNGLYAMPICELECPTNSMQSSPKLEILGKS